MVPELTFLCSTQYEKCSVMESGTENELLLINMNFLKKVFLILAAQFSIEDPVFFSQRGFVELNFQALWH